MNWNKDLRDWERDELEDMLDAIDVTISARKMARRHGLEDMDDLELDGHMLDILAEIERRDTEEQADALAAYYKAVIAV